MPKQLAKVMLACLLTAGGGYQIAYAQQSTGTSQSVGSCTGTVFDSNGEPVIGASVFVKGTSIGSATNFDGRFTLNGVKHGSTIQVSSVGYTTKEVVWNGGPLEITIDEANNALDEVVVVGYGTQKKVNLTGAVAAVSGEVLADRPITNIGQGLQGKIGNLLSLLQAVVLPVLLRVLTFVVPHHSTVAVLSCLSTTYRWIPTS